MIPNLANSPSLLLSLAIALAVSQVLAQRKSVAAITVAAYFFLTAILNSIMLKWPIGSQIIYLHYILSYLSLIIYIVSQRNTSVIDKIACWIYLLLMIDTFIMILDYIFYPTTDTWFYLNDQYIQVSADAILLILGAIASALPKYNGSTNSNGGDSSHYHRS